MHEDISATLNHWIYYFSLSVNYIWPEPVPDEAVSRFWALQVFIPQRCIADRHVPSRFRPGSHAINQHNSAALPLISARGVSGRQQREKRNDIKGRSEDSCADLQTVSPGER